eukprot:CAMPEP_0179299710 /NCGR_PEP_ID=MMETSP0797-20121207/46658_1 /TAXON_ID=47934 /ORGANISM="Dinophysis acuminata, Strain DAEP01" /LENGTH=450 /DNA_ID=CAMNT_0021009155 /DNA_START=51 /DNA_END=1403 /DNA_ORIENTATION=-
MATAQFSDDAYNKNLRGNGAGTLVANWFEERSIRDATGEGRSVPQRHITRSGLLKDFTKTPAGGPRRMDNTFERVYGPKAQHGVAPASTVIGDFKHDDIVRTGPRERALHSLRRQAAEGDVDEEEEIVAQLQNERSFETTHGATFTKPDELKAERAEHLKKSAAHELMHGPTPDRALAFGNDGLEVPTDVHYSNVEGITHHRMALANPRMRNDMKVSASGGVSAFGRHSDFSKPINEFSKGLVKDDELEATYAGMRATNPMRTLSGAEPRAGAFASVPSLPALKGAIHRQVAEAFGPYGYVALRQRLFDVADSEGFVGTGEIISVLRETGLGAEQVPDHALDVYLAQLVTMKKGALRVGAFISSLRPSLPQKQRRQVLEAFKVMSPVDGSVRLGDWLGKLGDPELRATIVTAFGAEDEGQVASMLMTENMFVELLSDLAPLTDVEPLLLL